MLKWVFAILLLFSFGVRAANIEATVNKKIIPLDEVFVLTITADEILKENPDLSSLSADFEVYSSSVSQSTYVVNQKVSNTTKWKVAVSAKNEGKLKIPAIKVGNDFSNEVEIEVLPKGAKTNEYIQNYQPKFEMKTQMDEQRSWYIQEQIPYNVIITDIGGLQGGEPVFDSSDDWIIKSLGQPDVVSKEVNGTTVREIIFKYVLFAQKSGALQIPVVRFNGYTISNQGSGIFSDNILSLNIMSPTGFGFETPVNLAAPAKNVYIMPVPSGYKGKWWLPAENVEIKAEFLDNNFMEGEAFRRNITVTATGVIDTQLPKLKFESTENIKQYPQKSTGLNEVVNNEPVAIQQTTNVYIPQVSGEVELPAISIEWFNVNTQRIEKSEVKAQKIMVQQNPKIKKAEVKNQSQNMDKKENNLVSKTDNSITLSQLLIVVLCVFFVGVLLGYYIFKPRKYVNNKPQCEPRDYPDFIIKKAYAEDFRGLRDSLISWAISFYTDKNITTLKDIADASNDDCFKEQVEILTAKLYNPKDERSWNAKSFADSFKNITKKTDKKEKSTTILPKLYQ